MGKRGLRRDEEELSKREGERQKRKEEGVGKIARSRVEYERREE